MKPLNSASAIVILFSSLLACGLVHAEDTKQPNFAADFKSNFSSQPTPFQDYLVQDAAATVAASELVGIAPGAIQVMENTRDFTMYLKGLNGDGSGGGFAITPARVKNPIPSITVEQYKHSAWARILAAMTISYAQGSAETDGKKYKRRAFSIASNWYPHAEKDDPVYESIRSSESCLASFDPSSVEGGVLRPQAASPKGGNGEPKTATNDPETYARTAGAYIKTCAAKSRAAVAARWYRPVVSLSIGTGDVGLDDDNSSSVGMGNHATVALRYGTALNEDDEIKPSDSVSGWAFYLSHKASRNAPVVSTLGTSTIERTSTNTTAVRLALGQSTWRALIEASNVNEKQAGAGEQALKKAIGLEYQVGKSVWLHFRYGKKRTISGQGEESAGLLSMTFGPEALQF